MASVSEQDLLEDRIECVRARDRRFSRNAYYFVLDALDFTIAHLGRDRLTGEERHVGGKELLAGISEFGSEQFGPMAEFVFSTWGIRSSEDFGEIVFNLVDAELLSRRPTDSRLDFAGGFDFGRKFADEHRRTLERISQNVR
ncbi:MAG: hypothetical protein Fur0037_21500 [Planctomycetota bacterium]